MADALGSRAVGGDEPCALPKARKNEAEIEGSQRVVGDEPLNNNLDDEGETLDDLDCFEDEICEDGFCVSVGGGGEECVDDMDCFEDEICDDGNALSGDGCNDTCTSVEAGFACPIEDRKSVV